MLYIGLRMARRTHSGEDLCLVSIAIFFAWMVRPALATDGSVSIYPVKFHTFGLMLLE